MTRRRRVPPRTGNLSVRLNEEEMGHVTRWADADPLDRGMGHVLRRLIDEEVRRERERHEAAGRAG